MTKPHLEQNLMRELARVVRKEDDRTCVLLVEDDEDLARIVIATFEQAGVEIFHAATRVKAIEMCQSIKPGIMILGPFAARRRRFWRSRLAATNA